MHTESVESIILLQRKMDDPLVYLLVISTAIVLLFFNIVSLFVLLVTPKLRRRVSNLPIISFLVGSALQGAIPAPLYIYKVLAHRSGNEPGWLCDVYRFQYIFCVHIMEASIMILALERLWAIKFPLRFSKLLKRRNVGYLLGSAWFVTLIIDLLPFFKSGRRNNDNCTYVPTPSWGLCVIIFFNIVPFVTVVVCYTVIWKVAFSFAIKDQRRAESLNFNQHHSCLLNNRSDDGTNTTTTDGHEDCCHNKVRTSSKQSYHKVLKFTLEIKATKTSLAIAAVFLICWLPMGIFYMADHFCRNCISDDSAFKLARRIVKILAFSSSLLTPLVYCWWNKAFRKSAKRLLRRHGTSLSSGGGGNSNVFSGYWLKTRWCFQYVGNRSEIPMFWRRRLMIVQYGKLFLENWCSIPSPMQKKNPMGLWKPCLHKTLSYVNSTSFKRYGRQMNVKQTLCVLPGIQEIRLNSVNSSLWSRLVDIWVTQVSLFAVKEG